METLYKSKYIIIEFDKARSYMKVTRTKETEFYNDEEYLKENKIWESLVDKYKPKYALIDQREFYYIVAPDIQELLKKTIIKTATKNKLKKLAIVEPEDLFTKASVYQIFDDINNFYLQYFKDIESAEKWLFE